MTFMPCHTQQRQLAALQYLKSSCLPTSGHADCPKWSTQSITQPAWCVPLTLQHSSQHATALAALLISMLQATTHATTGRQQQPPESCCAAV